MTGSRYRQYLIATWFVFIFGLVACGPGSPDFTPTATRRVVLTPFFSVTPSRTISAKPATARTSTPPPSPTPTPITYKVVRGDTMLGIALRYGISLEDLLAANPDVDPQFLSVGIELVIPLGESAPPALATATPLPITISRPDCYFTSDRGLYCFILARNPLERPVENLLAQIRLVATDGDFIAEGEAIPPLNLLPSKAAMPLTIFFEPGTFENRTRGGNLEPGNFIADVTLLSALQLPPGDTRYAKTRDPEFEVSIDPNGLVARVTGSIRLRQNSRPAGQVWVAVVAYDEAGKVAGLRKWEAMLDSASTRPAEDETRRLLSAPLKPGERLEFSLSVFSLGPRIQRVEVLVEARPVDSVSQE